MIAILDKERKMRPKCRDIGAPTPIINIVGRILFFSFTLMWLRFNGSAGFNLLHHRSSKQMLCFITIIIYDTVFIGHLCKTVPDTCHAEFGNARKIREMSIWINFYNLHYRSTILN